MYFIFSNPSPVLTRFLLFYVVSAELEYCGHIPLDVTQERATVRYLSECIWGYETGDEGIAYYGRDVDITVTCWAKGTEVMGDP